MSSYTPLPSDYDRLKMRVNKEKAEFEKSPLGKLSALNDLVTKRNAEADKLAKADATYEAAVKKADDAVKKAEQARVEAIKKAEEERKNTLKNSAKLVKELDAKIAKERATLKANPELSSMLNGLLGEEPKKEAAQKAQPEKAGKEQAASSNTTVIQNVSGKGLKLVTPKQGEPYYRVGLSVTSDVSENGNATIFCKKEHLQKQGSKDVYTIDFGSNSSRNVHVEKSGKDTVVKMTVSELSASHDAAIKPSKSKSASRSKTVDAEFGDIKASSVDIQKDDV